MRNWRAASSSAKRPATRRVMARTQARVSRSFRSTGVRSFTACARVARTEADSTSYCCAPARAPPAPSAPAIAKMRLGSRALRIGQASGYVARHLGGGDLGGLRITAVLVLDHAFLEPAVADHHAMRDADELLVGEQHAGALVAVVEVGLDALGAELRIERVGGGAHGVAAVVTHRNDRNREGRHRVGPDDA